jgi:predicted type IV restriction endonuclease
MAISKRVADRVGAQIKRYQTILGDAKDRDISESDTVVIIGDMLADIFGYKKYVDITTEFAIRGTFVDLAVKVDGDVYFLIEVKAIGVELKDIHVKQAIDYGANQGIEWVVLTNGICWRIYRIEFKKPIDKRLAYEIDLLRISHKDDEIIENIGTLTREGFTKSSMTDFFQRQQVMSKFSLAGMIVTEPVLKVLRRELRRISPNLKLSEDDLSGLLQEEVFKREVVESEEAKAAADYIKKAQRAIERSKAKEKEEESNVGTPSAVIAGPAAVVSHSGTVASAKS